MDKFIRVNVKTGKITTSGIPKEYSGLGGRGLTSSIVSAEVHPRCHPLSADNKLIISPGTLTGTVAASAGRLSVGAKSPLTGGIKESSPGGVIAVKLARLGIAAIVFEDAPPDAGLRYLLVNKSGVELLPADDLKGLGCNDTVLKLTEKYGTKAGYLCIGQPGELKCAAASIGATDLDNLPTRHAGRGGLGAVMGSKGIKAVVAIDTGSKSVEPGDRAAFIKFNKMWVKAVMDDPATGQGMPAFGSSVAITIMNKEGALPTRNFRSGEFEFANDVSGKAMRAAIKARGAKMTEPCSPGCVVRCHRGYIGPRGQNWGKAPEYETLWAFGANLGIRDLDAVCQMNHLCNDFGVDTIDMGVAVAMAMEAGICEFGDHKGALKLVKEVGKGSYLGRILASGAANCAKIFGVSRVPAVKGQAMVAYDPRVLKGMGVTEAMSTMGADHGAGYMTGPNLGWTANWRVVPKLQAEGQVEVARELHQFQTSMDCTGLCQFLHTPLLNSKEAMVGVLGMINIMQGLNWSQQDFVAYGAAILKKEREFNLAAGLSPAQDRLPLFFSKEPVPPLNTVFDIPDEELDSFYNW